MVKLYSTVVLISPIAYIGVEVGRPCVCVSMFAYVWCVCMCVCILKSNPGPCTATQTPYQRGAKHKNNPDLADVTHAAV